MMVAPTEDDDMPKEGVDELISVVEPVYEASGHPEHFPGPPPAGHTHLQAGVLRLGGRLVR